MPGGLRHEARQALRRTQAEEAATVEKYLFIGATLALTVYGQLMMKWRAVVHGDATHDRMHYLWVMYTDIGVLSSLAGALLASITWSLALQRVPLAAAYPFMALTFALVPLAGVLLFRESLAPLQILGLLLIVVGVSLSVSGNS